MIRDAWEDTSTNLVDFLTKMKKRAKREAIIDQFMYQHAFGSVMVRFMSSQCSGQGYRMGKVASRGL